MQSSSSYPEGSMKSLMEAVAQVTNRPVLPGAYSQLTASTNAFAYPGPNGMIAHLPLPTPSSPTSIDIDVMPFANNQGDHLRKRKQGNVLPSSEFISATKKARASAVSPHNEDHQEDKRSKRLEQNRLAAVESRRRKKHMVEELQRSVQYYSKANATLKSQNADLERQLLVAKQKAFIIIENLKSEGNGNDSTSVKAAIQDASISNNKTFPPQETKPTESLTPDQLTPVHINRPYSALIGSTSKTTSNTDMEKQEQLAQFAATQALYKSMGYPAGAARVAASTFSQFVGQTGTVPVLSPTQTKAVPPKTTVAVPATPKVKKVESDDTAYIQALNRFAMQQAAAANAAAAAASAAIQAAHLHDQLKKKGSSSSSIQAMPTLSFSYPAGVPWPVVQNHASSTKTG
mmetsp:Transcript_36833/g.77278  ORF Transcript_36833/g.77278 Transcript_36833/m.77278 type:complete len:403 (+) Transcript_36833:124-1332(+)|eukprot:CAMPEP_0196204736 /NCGR_PEP_ID=MMETSP0912-20130531/6745_1 /TAXON_ID=49265 /ORGANISM="Thalassiosira rotula, Strain GSO102" /LENGTH=402 /DNA_ID=CAMNT_0041479021 /DNA_START=21 /DNA_END=1229 /DNA_ORIENTATION=+